MFIRDAPAVLFWLKKRDALGLTNPGIDARSSVLRDRAVRAAKGAPDRTIMVVGELSQLALEEEILSWLRKHRLVRQIDQQEDVVAYQLQWRP